MLACRASRLLALVLLLAGCGATTGDKFTANRDAAAAPAADVSPPAAAVMAFGHLCGPLQWQEVQRRAGTYGFLPVDPSRLPPGIVVPAGVRMMVRTGPMILSWNDAEQGCELAVSGIDTAALIGEFDALLRAFERRPDVVVTSIAPAADQTGPYRLQRAAVLTPRALVPTPPWAMMLSTAAPGSQGFQALMKMRVARPGSAPTPPPPGPGAPKG